jgi:hypothetical protein
MYSLCDCATLAGVTDTSREYVPYVPGPTGPSRTAPQPQPAQPQPTPAPMTGPAGGQIVGESVDLARELRSIRKLGMWTMGIASMAMVFAVLAALLAGYLTYTLISIQIALHDAGV